MVGYSGTPLARKIGVKPGLVVYADVSSHDPVPVDLEALGLGDVARRLPGSVDITLLFTSTKQRLLERLPRLVERTVANGMVWVCWPKKAAKVPTDLDENLVRGLGLELGVVDVKVAAIDEVWSGLKFVRRLADR